MTSKIYTGMIVRDRSFSCHLRRSQGKTSVFVAVYLQSELLNQLGWVKALYIAPLVYSLFHSHVGSVLVGVLHVGHKVALSLIVLLCGNSNLPPVRILQASS